MDENAMRICGYGFAVQRLAKWNFLANNILKMYILKLKGNIMQLVDSFVMLYAFLVRRYL